MRQLTDHIINPVNDKLVIKAMDEPGSGGAHHRYLVFGFDTNRNPNRADVDDQSSELEILFQNGPIAEEGVNGVTHEALLAIVADRLRSFQKGQYSCKANACALTHIEEALHWMQQRTIERMRRGVEGASQV